MRLKRLSQTLPLMTGAILALVASAEAKLVPQHVESYFVRPNVAQPLVWNREGDAPSGEVAYVIRDYAGKTVRDGHAAVAADGTLTLPVQLSAGFYDVEFPAVKQSFGVMAIEPFAGKRDPIFGMDSALSWLELRPEQRESLIKILARSGVSMSRERLNIGALNPQADTWDWNTNRNYESIRKSYGAAGVPVLEMMYGMPSRTADKGDRYPQQLTEISKIWEQISRRFSSSWGAVEVWNEPDLIALPADQYVPLAKVAAYAQYRAGVSAPIVGGVFSGYIPGAYQDVCAANGMLENVDAVSFHLYEDAPEIEAMTVLYRKWLAKNNREGMPIWLTECGRPWTIGPDRAPQGEDAKTALEIAMKAAEARAVGIGVYCPFVYVFYEEAGAKNFGMMGREVTPLRSMASYAFGVQMLAHHEYLGDLKEPIAGVRLARVFGQGTSRVVVLYTGKVNADATVKLPFDGQRILGADGRVLSAANGEIPISDGMVYVVADAAKVDPHLNKQTRAAELLAMSRQKQPARGEPSPIVLQHVQKNLKSRVSSRRYLIDGPTAQDLSITVRVQNLSNQSQTVTPTLQLPGAQAGTAGQSYPQNAVEVGAGESRELTWQVNARDVLDPTELRFVRVTAKVANGPAVSPLAIPLTMEADLATHLARHPIKIPLVFDRLESWRQNIAPKGTCTFAAADGVWSMSVDFGESGVRWSYPRLALSQKIDPSVCTGVLVRARIANPARNVAMMVFEKGRATFWVNEIMPADGQWHVVFVPLDEFTPMNGHPDMQNAVFRPERVEDISVGCSSNTPTNKLEISDLLLVGRKK